MHAQQKSNTQKNNCGNSDKAIDETAQVGYSSQATRQKRESKAVTPIRFENAINPEESIAITVYYFTTTAGQPHSGISPVHAT